MVGNIRVSVAMVSYNGKNYIEEQMDSILIQLSDQDELVISDDGSGDGTREIIKEYQKKDRRVRLLEGPGKGIKKNVEHVLRQCRGRYIFLADQDDIWDREKVKKVLAALERQDVTLVIHDARVFWEDPGQVRMESFFTFRSSGPGWWKNIVKNSYIGCCMAFQRELLDKVLPIPKNIEMHDQWIGVLNDIYGTSCFLEEPLLLYRRHGDNNSGMTHYGIGRMIQNRVVFIWHFVGRILHIC